MLSAVSLPAQYTLSDFAADQARALETFGDVAKNSQRAWGEGIVREACRAAGEVARAQQACDNARARMAVESELAHLEYVRGMALQQAGRFKAAEVVLASYLKDFPNSPDATAATKELEKCKREALYAVAMDHLAYRHWDDVQRLFERYHRDYPEDPRAAESRFFAVRARYEQGDSEAYSKWLAGPQISGADFPTSAGLSTFEARVERESAFRKLGEAGRRMSTLPDGPDKATAQYFYLISQFNMGQQLNMRMQASRFRVDYPDNPMLDEIDLLSAYAYAKDAEYEAAARGYLHFLDAHPNSPLAPIARHEFRRYGPLIPDFLGIADLSPAEHAEYLRQVLWHSDYKLFVYAADRFCRNHPDTPEAARLQALAFRVLNRYNDLNLPEGSPFAEFHLRCALSEARDSTYRGSWPGALQTALDSLKAEPNSWMSGELNRLLCEVGVATGNKNLFETYAIQAKAQAMQERDRDFIEAMGLLRFGDKAEAHRFLQSLGQKYSKETPHYFYLNLMLQEYTTKLQLPIARAICESIVAASPETSREWVTAQLYWGISYTSIDVNRDAAKEHLEAALRGGDAEDPLALEEDRAAIRRWLPAIMH